MNVNDDVRMRLDNENVLLGFLTVQPVFTMNRGKAWFVFAEHFFDYAIPNLKRTVMKFYILALLLFTLAILLEMDWGSIYAPKYFFFFLFLPLMVKKNVSVSFIILMLVYQNLIYLYKKLSLPRSCISMVPCNTVFGSQYKMVNFYIIVLITI